MSQLRTADPAGRLDVLAFRLSERVAQRVCPNEWPAFAPHVERWAASNLGVLPKSWEDAFFRWTDQYTYHLPVSTSPAASAPKAPITKTKLLTWSLDDLAEAEAQRGAQYKIDTASGVASDWPTIQAQPASAPTEETNKLLWAGIGVASVVGLLWLVRR